MRVAMVSRILETHTEDKSVDTVSHRAAFMTLFPHRKKEGCVSEAGVVGWVPCACPAGGGPIAGLHFSTGIEGLNPDSVAWLSGR